MFYDHLKFCISEWCQDTLHYDIQNNGTQHYGTRHNDIQHYKMALSLMLMSSVVTLNVIYADCTNQSVMLNVAMLSVIMPNDTQHSSIQCNRLNCDTQYK
jgi:hypothetical protein